VVIVFNPAAGRRRAQLLWRVLDVMSANGVRLELTETRHPGHAFELARSAACAGVKLVVAAGGDGTIAEVANGLSSSTCRLGIIPLGTANVLAHELGLPFAPLAVAASLAFSRSRAVWPGVVSGGGGKRLFVQMLGAGFDAQVVHHLSVRLKGAIGRGAYVAQSLREAARYKFAPIRLRIDGQQTEAFSVIITKGHFYAGRYMLAPGASPMEKGFSVVLFDRGGPVSALMYGAALTLNMIPRVPGIRLLRATTVEICCTDIPAQADGDAAGETPLLVTDAAAPVNVVVG
jgi:diacylglycerol kinase (ATP)